jgi:hypothetical protein
MVQVSLLTGNSFLPPLKPGHSADAAMNAPMT